MFTSLREVVEALDCQAPSAVAVSERGVLERLEVSSGLVGRDVGGDADSSLPRALSHQVLEAILHHFNIYENKQTLRLNLVS